MRGVNFVRFSGFGWMVIHFILINSSLATHSFMQIKKLSLITCDAHFIRMEKHQGHHRQERLHSGENGGDPEFGEKHQRWIMSVMQCKII